MWKDLLLLGYRQGGKFKNIKSAYVNLNAGSAPSLSTLTSCQSSLSTILGNSGWQKIVLWTERLLASCLIGGSTTLNLLNNLTAPEAFFLRLWFIPLLYTWVKAVKALCCTGSLDHLRLFAFNSVSTIIISIWRIRNHYSTANNVQVVTFRLIKLQKNTILLPCTTHHLETSLPSGVWCDPWWTWPSGAPRRTSHTGTPHTPRSNLLPLCCHRSSYTPMKGKDVAQTEEGRNHHLKVNKNKLLQGERLRIWEVNDQPGWFSPWYCSVPRQSPWQKNYPIHPSPSIPVCILDIELHPLERETRSTIEGVSSQLLTWLYFFNTELGDT